jgi:catechol 2,3-dioxygenase-like lactoylglutathione lyase family enzyme
MPVLGLSHFNLRAPRPLLDELKDFYVDVVGLRPGFRPSFQRFGYWLYAGDLDVLHLTEADGCERQALDVLTTLDHVALKCAGRASYEAALLQHNVEFKVASVPQTRQVQLYFDDPAGNGVELIFSDTDA